MFPLASWEESPLVRFLYMLQSITKRVSDASSLSCPAHDCSLSSNQAVFPKCKDEPLLGPFTAKRKRHLARRLRSFSRDAALCYAIPGEQPPWTHPSAYSG